MVVLFAILLPLFLGLGAIAVDVSYWYVVRKTAQDTADAAALAGAQAFPNKASVRSFANEYVNRNMTGAAAQIDENYGPSQVEVIVTHDAETFFGGLLGILDVTVTRRAVAEKEIIDNNMAIFAGSRDCDNALRINGANINVDGHVHSNGQFLVNSQPSPDNFWAYRGTQAQETCDVIEPDGPPPEAAGARFGEGDEWEPQTTAETTWPEWYVPAQFGWHLPEAPGPGRCTYKGEHIQIDATHLKITGKPDTPLLPNPTGPGTLIPTGTYCATGSFKIGGDNHKGTITALSPLIVVDGNGQDYTPYDQGVLFFTVQNNDNITTNDGPFAPGDASPPDIPPNPPCSPAPSLEMQLNGTNYTWAGVIFNPCGKVKLNNNDSNVGTPDLVGTILGFQVEINGAGFNMVGTGSEGSNFLLALVE